MEPIVDLAPGAEDNSLAVHFAECIRQNLADGQRKRRDFAALRGTFLIVAQDAYTSLTLRFDHGRLTIHDGPIGIPTITFCGDREVLLRLSQIPLCKFLRLPIAFSDMGGRRALLGDLLAGLIDGRLKVYGLLARPRLVLTFLRVLSAEG